MLAIIKREFKAYFSSPTGFVFMGFFLLLTGFFFVMANVLQASPDYNSVLGSITFVFLIVVPVLTMRLISEETRQKTDQLLLTSPLSLTKMVLGKYFAAVGVFLLTLLITALYPVFLSFFGTIGVWEILGGYIGFFLLGSSFIAVGLFVSSLTDNQVVAAIVTFVSLLLMWLIDWIQQGIPVDRVSGIIFSGLLVLGAAVFVYFTTRTIFVSISVFVVGSGVVTGIYFLNPIVFDGLIVRVLDWFSLLARYGDFAMGVLSISPIVYYITFCAIFVFLTIRVIEKRRWS
jgi:ABC-2 type transport system permease protein